MSRPRPGDIVLIVHPVLAGLGVVHRVRMGSIELRDGGCVHPMYARRLRHGPLRPLDNRPLVTKGVGK